MSENPTNTHPRPDSAPRTDGGPGRFATCEALEAALEATRERDELVINYLWDK